MDWNDLQAAFERPEDEPSDLKLDRYLAGELAPEDAQAVRAYAEAHPDFAARLSQRRAGFAAHPEVDERALLRGLRAAAEERGRSDGGWRRLWSALWWVTPAVAAVAALLILQPGDGPTPDLSEPGATSGEGSVRLKGGLKLEVIRKRGEHTEDAVSGADFRPGDRLRFRITTPAAGRVQIVGVEPGGALYVAWPMPEHAQEPSVLPAQKRKLLDGAIELDATVGTETLHLVLCPSEVDPHCESAGASQAPRCAAGCRTTPFTLNKVP